MRQLTHIIRLIINDLHNLVYTILDVKHRLYFYHNLQIYICKQLLTIINHYKCSDMLVYKRKMFYICKKYGLCVKNCLFC